MHLTLIPVTEIGYNNEGVPAPEQYPYWEFPDLWNSYHKSSYQKAGFEDQLVPYLAGSSFYKLSEITVNNLTRIVRDHLSNFLAAKYDREQVNALSGGYVLNLDGIDVFYPQCCADLGDLTFLENLLDNKQTFYSGHPDPDISFTESHITFNFETSEYDEPFVPPPPYSTVSIEKSELAKALIRLRAELIDLSEILKNINTAEQWNIADIDKLLIWSDDYVPRL